MKKTLTTKEQVAQEIVEILNRSSWRPRRSCERRALVVLGVMQSSEFGKFELVKDVKTRLMEIFKNMVPKKKNGL